MQISITMIPRTYLKAGIIGRFMEKLRRKTNMMGETMMSQEQNKPNTGTYESTNRMTEPPAVITTKDLSYLQDAMSWELLAFKKCRQYAAFATDPEIQHQIDSAGQLHQKHYNLLLNYLQSNPNQQYLQ